MNKYKKTNRTSQQIKKEQINFLLEDVEKNLEEYKTALKSREKQLSYAKKLLVSAKNSYDRTVAENKELKPYIQNIKQRQQAQFLENQKNYYEKTQPKRYKKVVYEEKPDSEPELEEEEYCADKKEEEPEIKKKKKKRAEKRKYFALYKQGCKEK